MFVGVDDDGLVAARYNDEKAEFFMKRVPEVVLLKAPDEFGRGIYEYKTSIPLVYCS